MMIILYKIGINRACFSIQMRRYQLYLDWLHHTLSGIKVACHQASSTSSFKFYTKIQIYPIYIHARIRYKSDMPI
jgi:hypothetical protein